MSVASRRILHLVPSWEHVGVLRRIGMLAAHFDRSEFEFRIASVSSRGPDPNDIMGRPVPSAALASGRRLPIALAPRLRRLIRDWSPNVLHAWSPGTARLSRLALAGVRGVLLKSADLEDYSIGVNLGEFRRAADTGLAREQVLAELDLPPQAKLLGTAGQLTRRKRVTELLWALDQIRCVREDVYLLIIGDGEARPHYERYARLYQVADRSRFLGWRKNAPTLIKHLDVYCSAREEPWPSLAMLEAMALGVPVVAGDTPAHRQFVLPRETGILVDIGQRSEMARWCLHLLEDRDLAAHMADAGRQRIAESFAFEPVIERFRRAYRAMHG